MIELTLARRYAQALIDLGVKRGEVAKIEQELLGFAKLYDESALLRRLLLHPRVPRAEKKRIMEKLLPEGSSVVLRDFLKVLLDKNRLEYLPEIASLYDELADATEGVVRVEVRSFGALESSDENTLRGALEKLTARRVDMRVVQDRALVGGVQVRIKNTVLDGSVAGRLRRLSEQLLEHEITA